MSSKDFEAKAAESQLLSLSLLLQEK